MGKRSNFERIPRDFYPTPESAVIPLLPHLAPETHFSEPCAGDGRLVGHLEKHGHVCVYASDIEPRAEFVAGDDALNFEAGSEDFVITNPPWDRRVLHPLIERFATQRPTWLLFDSDWMHTKQSAPFMPWLQAVVSVGRVKWIEDSPFTGKDNCCWYLFNANADPLSYPASFYGRAA